jgi:Kdo2-lipid IVA lauroyltransferase/acyltransferase
MPARWPSRLGLAVMRLLRFLPLSWVRALGWALGHLLHAVAAPRRRIARTNWALCFPQLDESERHRAVRQHFIVFAQAWLDRSWLWEGQPDLVRRRVKLVGDLAALDGSAPTVLFAPHFVGMDAGWTGLTLHLERKCCGLYAEQSNPEVDRWMAQGRQRFGQPHIVAQRQGLKPLIAALRSGEPLYLLPDMDYGARDSVFVPFFGVSAATISSLPRFARLSGAKVVPIVTRLTREGYEIEVMSPWQNYPSQDMVADTALMNQRLEALIATMPEQYYWVHKRFKTRPAGEASLYGRD